VTVNGCGPGWWPKVWKDSYFEEECAVHDVDYTRDKPQSVADRDFLDSMKAKLKRENGSPGRWAQAYVFYGLVRLFGHFHKEK
jgi:hypothetical protein